MFYCIQLMDFFFFFLWQRSPSGILTVKSYPGGHAHPLHQTVFAFIFGKRKNKTVSSLLWAHLPTFQFLGIHSKLRSSDENFKR